MRIWYCGVLVCCSSDVVLETKKSQTLAGFWTVGALSSTLSWIVHLVTTKDSSHQSDFDEKNLVFARIKWQLRIRSLSSKKESSLGAITTSADARRQHVDIPGWWHRRIPVFVSVHRWLMGDVSRTAKIAITIVHWSTLYIFYVLAWPYTETG